jgi:hypothetical protein
MTTTDIFQKNPDYYLLKEELLKSIHVNTNPRYKYYKQTHFTVGDEDQFHHYRDYQNNTSKEIVLDENIFFNRNEIIENLDWKRYHNLNEKYITSTFRYIFNKFKKGIFLKISNNKLVCFLPFSKNNFTNEWKEYIFQDPSKFKNITEFIIYCAKMQNIEIYESQVNKFVSTWYFNNCLIRPEFPLSEGDSGVSNIKDMFIELCKNRQIPDIEIFINRRDFPILKKDLTEPYSSIFGTENLPLLSHSFTKYFPILGMTTTSLYSDILIPTIEDWARASSQSDRKYFVPPRDFRYNFSIPFSERKNKAVFRGASTGEGTTIETNPRLKLAYLSTKIPDKLDAGITKWNTRVRKEFSNQYLSTIEPHKLPFGIVSFMTPEKQAEYKYIVNVDGHSAAYRFGLELSTGSVILKVESKYIIWFQKYLKPFYHYIPIKKDLSDLEEKIDWCNSHEKECEKIALNAKEFYLRYLTKEGILDYIQYLLVQLSQKMGNYLHTSHLISKISKNFMDDNLENLELNLKSSSYKLLQYKYISSNLLNIKFKKIKDIYSNENTEISLYEFDKTEIYFKKCKKNDELNNDNFIGVNCVNRMLEYIPNFRYTFGKIDENLLMEKIDGLSFSCWINNHFNTKQYLWILFQLGLTLQFSRNFCMFSHRDLNPWNIIIKKLDKPILINYPIFNHGVYQIKTDIYPILIDYGKSRATFKDVYIGLENILEYSPFLDILTILYSTIFLVIKLSLGSDQIRTILNLSSIFYKTTSLVDLKAFVFQRKKYNEIVYGNKDIARNFQITYFISHLQKINDFTLSIPSNRYGFKILNNYKIKRQIEVDKNVIKEIITEFLESKKLEDIYVLNILNKFVPVGKVEWKGILEIPKIHDLKLDEYIFSDIERCKKNLDKMYIGNLSLDKLFQIYNLIYTDELLEKDTLDFIYQELKDYESLSRYLCDSKSFKYYGSKI